MGSPPSCLTPSFVVHLEDGTQVKHLPTQGAGFLNTAALLHEIALNRLRIHVRTRMNTEGHLSAERLRLTVLEFGYLWAHKYLYGKM